VSFSKNCFSWLGYIVHLQKFLQSIKYIITGFIPSPALLYSPIPGIISTGIIFAFTYMCTQYLHHIHPPMFCPHIIPTSDWYQHSPPPSMTWSALLFSDFVEEKKKDKKITQLLLWNKDSYTGNFHVIFPCIYVL
jgi:hypothetical protein